MKRSIMGMLGVFRVVHIVRLVMIDLVVFRRFMTMIANTVVIGIINCDGMDQTSQIVTERMAMRRRSSDRAET